MASSNRPSCTRDAEIHVRDHIIRMEDGQFAVGFGGSRVVARLLKFDRSASERDRVGWLRQKTA